MKRILSTSILVLLTIISSSALAEFDFSGYVPVLDKSYDAGETSINSGYMLNFKETSAGAEDFIYYRLNSDNTTTPVYYTIEVERNDNPVGTFYNTMQNAGVTSGYFEGITGSAHLIASAITNLTADYIKNNAVLGTDKIFQNNSSVDFFKGDFIKNTGLSSGGIVFNTGTIGEFNGNLIGNSVNVSLNTTLVGANFHNSTTGSIGKLNVNFIGNSFISSGGGQTGALLNENIITEINGDFIGNSVNTTRFSPNAAAINNTSRGNITLINGNFIGNLAITAQLGNGGAIYNSGIIETIIGDFIDNSIKTTTVYAGTLRAGAVYNGKSIGTISGNFINNSIFANNQAQGGAIYNNLTMTLIEGNFIGNIASGKSYGFGGALFNNGTLTTINGNFINNVSTSPNISFGGALLNSPRGVIDSITGDFIGNRAEAALYVQGGAISNDGIFNSISSSFIDNSAIINVAELTNQLAIGGAIYTMGNMTFSAVEKDNFFTGNFTKDSRGIDRNAIFVYADDTTQLTLTFKTAENGNFIFEDTISGGNDFIDWDYQYDINIEGDKTGKFFMNNAVINAGEVRVSGTMLLLNKGPHGQGNFLSGLDSSARSMGNAVTSLTLTNGELYLHNNYFDTINLKNYTSTTGEDFLHINVGKNGGVWTSDILNVSGDVDGQTQVVVYALTPDTDLTSVVFVNAPNDTVENPNAFTVYRTYGSPFVYEAKRNVQGTETGSVWYLTITNESNEYIILPSPILAPGYVPPVPVPIPAPDIEVNPEIIDYRGLQAASMEQTRNMIWNVKNKSIAVNAWVNPVYFYSEIDTPVEIEANIWGLEAGFDIGRNNNNKLGVFFSYRRGDYDLNGKGEKYYSNTDSAIDIDSYIAGLYHRFDYKNIWTFATLYGGLQKSDIHTKDGISVGTDGTQLGGSLEIGYNYILAQDISLSPSISASYTQIDFDDIKDNFGKVAKYDTVSQWELEAGLKLEKQFETANVYIMPSIVKPITDGDNVAITGLNNLSTYNDKTLGRVEFGGKYDITTQFSTYGFINHTFGSNYESTSIGLGLNYAW